MITSCCDPAFGAGTSGGGGGECCSLEDTLAIGNTTGGNDIIITTGDEIVGQTTLVMGSLAGATSISAVGSINLLPSVTALVGVETIVTTASNLGAGAQVFGAKGAGGANGANITFRSLVGGANVTITQNANDISIASSGAAAAWSAVLAAGNTSGATNPVISTGQMILGQTALELRAQGDGYGATIRAADGSSAAAGQTRDVNIFGGTATGGGVQGGRILLWGGSGNGTQPGGPIRANGGTGGSTSGLGGAIWFVGGQGGTPNGDGGNVLLEGGAGVGFGIGGRGDMVGGNGYSGGAVSIRGGNGVSNHAGSATVGGGTAAGNGNGGNTYLVPTAASGAGTTGTAWVGAQSIVTRASNLGAGSQVFSTKALEPSIDGSRLDFRSIIGTAPIVATQNANDITISTTALAPSSGCEICLNDSVAGDIASTTRQMTIKGRQSVHTQYSVNIAAGTRTITMRARSLVAGQTTTIRNRSILGQSNLGTTNYDPETAAFTTTSNTFVNVTSSSTVLIAGEWIVFFSMDLEPPP